jgi:hypothetical protein
MLKDKLLAAASVRKEAVKIDGDEFLVREVTTEEFATYGELRGKDKVGAAVYLIAQCVLDEAGGRLLTDDDAKVVASSARVSMQLINKILNLTGFDGKEEDEKHANGG